MKKSEIYNSYGINYQGGKIQTPAGEWINPLLKKGNKKTGAGVYTFSQLAGCRTWDTDRGPIQGTCACNCENCYACTGFYNMPSVINSLALNTIITRDFIDFKIAAVTAQIIADHITIVRVHAAGDFDSISDVNAWEKIAAACPSTRFYTYTKRGWAEIDFLNASSNFNIVPSIISGRYNYGPCNALLELLEACPGAYICPCGFDDSIHCDTCKACAEKKHVIFLLHSTSDYNGAADPLYNKLKKIVINQ